MGRGSTDKNTIRLQNYMRLLQKTNRARYNDLDELLAQHGYIVYSNKSNVLMVRKPKHVNGLDSGAIHLIINGADLSDF